MKISTLAHMKTKSTSSHRPVSSPRSPASRVPRPLSSFFLLPSSFFLFFLALSANPQSAIQNPQFITPAPPASPAIYHPDWIDLNKNGIKDPYEDPTLPVDRRIDDLLARMTIEEKTAQMVTLYGYPRVLKDELPTAAWATAFWKDGIGNIDEHMNSNTGPNNDYPRPKYALPYSLHARAINEIQRWFIEHTRLGIPVDFTNEGVRGLLHAKSTTFPHQIGVASTWDAPLVREMARVEGREARALGYTNVYSPILDVARDPRWGRIVETYGEDPFLVSELGVQQVLGIQEQNVVSTLKHFAVYSIPKGGRDGSARTDPQATWREVQTIFLPAFKRAIRDAGALGVMSSYNDYDGIPIQSSKLFLTDILRGEFGFRGYVVSDSGAVEFIHTKHRTAPTPDDAIRQAVEAGLNIRTRIPAPDKYVDSLRQLVRDGKLSTATIDARVRDILRVKFWLGLFDHPYTADPSAADKIVHSPESQQLALRADREAIILLKNTPVGASLATPSDKVTGASSSQAKKKKTSTSPPGAAAPSDNPHSAIRNPHSLLPLHAAALTRILIAGPLADNAAGWASRYGGQQIDYITPLAGIRAKLAAANPSAEIRYAQGVAAKDKNFPESDILKDPPDATVRAGIAAAVDAAKDVDLIIAVLGETDDLCRESNSRVNLNLPGYQEELLEALAATGKPVVLVLSNGRPLSINWAARHIPAIVEMWLPGETGGAALADVLFGDYNPAGRLPVTFPKSVGQIQMNFPAHPGSQAKDNGQVTGVLWPFGHGLSYTTFKYASLKITPAAQTGTIEKTAPLLPGNARVSRAASGVPPDARPGNAAFPPNAPIEITCDVTNTGPRAGDEVVQLYLRDDYATVITFEKSLRGFARVPLAPGETKTIHFTLTPEHLALYDRNHRWTVEPGHFTLYIGASSEDIRLTGGFDILGSSASPREQSAPQTDDTDNL